MRRLTQLMGFSRLQVHDAPSGPGVLSTVIFTGLSPPTGDHPSALRLWAAQETEPAGRPTRGRASSHPAGPLCPARHKGITKLNTSKHRQQLTSTSSCSSCRPCVCISSCPDVTRRTCGAALFLPTPHLSAAPRESPQGHTPLRRKSWPLAGNQEMQDTHARAHLHARTHTHTHPGVHLQNTCTHSQPSSRVGSALQLLIILSTCW